MITKITPENFNKVFNSSDKGRYTAIVRYLLVKEWEKYRANSNGNFKFSDTYFVSKYNSGVIFPQFKNAVKKISLSVLYKWKKALDEQTHKSVENWTTLIPAYYFNSYCLDRFNDTECWVDVEELVRITGNCKRTIDDKCRKSLYLKEEYINKENKYSYRIMLLSIETELQIKIFDDCIKQINTVVDAVEKLQNEKSCFNLVFNELLQGDSFREWAKNNLPTVVGRLNG